jgi:dTDP-D-glucose 4,6-dehydratase
MCEGWIHLLDHGGARDLIMNKGKIGATYNTVAIMNGPA